MCSVWRMLPASGRQHSPATTGQTTIGTGTQSDLLMMKHVEIILITNKSLFVASSWFLLYLLTINSVFKSTRTSLLTFRLRYGTVV